MVFGGLVRASTDLIFGVFVGGASRRMGTSKGLLLAPDGSGRTLVERLTSEIERAFPGVPVVLVGKREEYVSLGYEFVEDEIPSSGPLGGVVGLLSEAERRGVSRIFCVACDHPFLGAELLTRIVVEHAEASICCPFLDDRYQPLVARYDVRLLPEFRRALHQGERALQPLLREQEAARLALSSSERDSLRDWDAPADMRLES